jgi:hypothetical protein
MTRLHAITAVLSETRTPEQVADVVSAGPPTGTGGEPQVFTRPPGERRAGRQVQVDVRNQLPGVLVGAAIALLGVWIGARLARRG